MTTYGKQDKNRWATFSGQAYYSSVVAPNKKFDPWSYQVSLVLDKESLEKAKGFNMNIKPAKDSIPGPYIQIKRALKDKTDAEVERCKPEVVGTKEAPYKAGSFVGNGSDVIVGCMVKDRPAPTTGKFGATLVKMQVVKLVPYEMEGNSGFLPEETVDADSNLDDDLPF
jgi:hypothetical protein